MKTTKSPSSEKEKKANLPKSLPSSLRRLLSVSLPYSYSRYHDYHHPTGFPSS